MKLAIIGSRDVPEIQENVQRVLEMVALLERKYGKLTDVVSGGAPGGDTIAQMAYPEAFKLSQVAEMFDGKVINRGATPLIKFKLFPADWERYGRRAGFLRDKQIADYATHGLALLTKPLEESKGTAHTVGMLRAQNKPVVLLKGF